MIKILCVDLFCGAGGTSSGIHLAEIDGEKMAEVVLCVNHDQNAIKSHHANFPDAIHLTEDIRKVSMDVIVKAIHLRKYFWENKGYTVYVMMWASLECTNFSKAKGGLPRDADSRTLAEHLFRYIDAYLYDYIYIENVEEFMAWGPLDKNGKPVSKSCGLDYLKWIDNVKSYGYEYDYRILNAADFGAYTSRKRYFGCFAQKGLSIKFPTPTHSKNAEKSLSTSFEKWKPVKECLDFEDKGESIFSRKKPLSEKTLHRIYAGLIKYVAGGKEAFVNKYNSFSPSSGYTHSVSDIDSPSPTVATQHRLALVSTTFLKKYYSGRPEGKSISIEGPAGTITTTDHHAMVSCTPFLQKYYKSGENLLSVDNIAPTLTTKDRVGIVYVDNVNWIDKQYGGSERNHSSVSSPLGTITNNNKNNLVNAKKWIMNTNFNNVGSDINSPSPTITANRKHHYLINPSWFGNSGSVDSPCCTIVARQDKSPLYFVTVKSDSINVAIPVFEDDSEMMIKIKEFMAIYNIDDISMRMLKIVELLKIQGFIEPDGKEDDYVLVGTQTEKKKYIGNSVVPLQVKVLIESMYAGLAKLLIHKVA